MALDVQKVKKLLAAFEFKPLFIEELGWNLHNATLDIPIDSQTYVLTAVAEKCGMAAFVCSPGTDGHIPDDQARRKIERQVAKSIHEHLIIFIDAKRTIQRWQWVRRERGKPAACREHPYHAGQPGDSLIQKLQSLAISLEEEESITLPDVTSRVKGAFDVERVTKRFYDLFKTEHETFLKFLKGIPDEEMERWYVSVMLNRLMFIYFIQKKGFLNNDGDYLRNKLAQCRKELGKDRYYSDFLCPLFFEGFAKRKEDRSDKVGKLLGEVPYLNGGIFMPHQIEQLHGKTITIPDKAFEQLFNFFDVYHWHLDERPLKKDNEINPDVLGYIFEKYINQKQMGAYYTKEDITDYISKSTIIPFLFDKAREKCKVAFEGERSIWRLLQEDPDGYIYPAVAHGIVWDARQTPPRRLESPFDLPSDIAAGIPDVSKRTDWNKPASSEYALPTEIWREIVARRKRYEEVRGKIAAGKVRSINDFITCNLDIRQFAQDVIEKCEGPELLVAFWKTIEAVTVLDPTCGSGAFLFAALNILDPLYDACLDRMQFFLEEWGEGGKKHHPNYYKLFSETLKRVDDHPNHKYFVLKSIIVNNLYGVDIMEEAIEICKLRLFLKLVAQTERTEHIEPLPDIDFNIRAGNTLVGFASLDEVRKTQEGKLSFGKDEVARIEEAAIEVDRLFALFRQQQTELGGTVTAADKENLRSRLRKLTDDLNKFLAGEYSVDVKKKDLYEKWLKSHQPFHWFAEFYGILNAGGFDVIIGNPPYVEYSKIRGQYTINHGHYITETTSNLYAFVVERSGLLLHRLGALGLIVPLSAFCTQRMVPLIKLVRNMQMSKWIAHFGWRPSKLFEGVNIPLSILIVKQSAQQATFTTTFTKWYSEYRSALFANLNYVKADPFLRFDRVIPKIDNDIELSILTKVFSKRKNIGAYITKAGQGTKKLFYRNTGGLYWRIFTDYQPFFSQNGKRMNSSTESVINFPDKEQLACATAVLNSNLYWFYYVVFSSFHHVNPPDILDFPIDFNEMDDECRTGLIRTTKKLMEDMQIKSKIQQRVHKGGSVSKIQTFYPSLSKSINDQIDDILKTHYGFTDNEVDYVINYDIKYRMLIDIEAED